MSKPLPRFAIFSVMMLAGCIGGVAGMYLFSMAGAIVLRPFVQSSSVGKVLIFTLLFGGVGFVSVGWVCAKLALRCFKIKEE